MNHCETLHVSGKFYIKQNTSAGLPLHLNFNQIKNDEFSKIISMTSHPLLVDRNFLTDYGKHTPHVEVGKT